MREWFLSASLLLVACGGSSSDAVPSPAAATGDAPASDPDPPATPSPPSSTGSPGWDAQKLDELSAYAESKGTKAFILVENDTTILEKYYAGATATYTRDVASVQKSVTSILAGIAISKGLVAVNDTVTSCLGAGWSNAAASAESKVTLRHLLTMTSGLTLKLEYAADPGTAWLYNDDAFYRVRMCLEAKTGKPMDAIAHEWLFDRVGMSASIFSPRPFGKDSKGLPIVSLKTSARDLLQFGLLLRAKGTWNGEVVVPAAIVDAATSTSQPLNESYGFLFWLNGKGGGRLPPSMPFTGPMVPSAPADAFAALGADDQKVYVARAEGLVLVRLGDAAGEAKNALSSFDEELWKRVMAAKK